MKHVTTLTGEPLESLSPELAKQEAKRIKALQRLRRLRTKASDEIERLLNFLDASDIDPDLEPTSGFMNGPAEQDECEIPEDAEPSLGSFDRMIDQSKSWRQGNLWNIPGVDAEQDDADGEPSLGSLDAIGDQELWASGDRRDLEPSLAGGGWSRSTDDREIDDGESGIGDADGLLEQIGANDWQAGREGMV